MSCFLCLQELPSASKRRRLYGPSSKAVLESLKEEARELQHEIPPMEASGSGPFLCLPCFQQIEKLSKAKAVVKRLQGEVRAKIIATASAEPQLG